MKTGYQDAESRAGSAGVGDRARLGGKGLHPWMGGIGMETFGASAPLKELQKKFGFTAENIIPAAKEQIAKAR